MLLVLYSNTLIRAPEYKKCILRGPTFKIFPGEDAPRPPYKVMPSALGKHTFGACCPFSAYSSDFVAYKNSYWKPCISGAFGVWKMEPIV